MDIRVLGFKTKINKAGKAVDWVEYAPAHAINNSTTVARVKDLIPPDEMDHDRDPQGSKMFHMKAVWSFIEPHYDAWKKGTDMPETGTPLTAWPAVSEAEIFELNRVGLKSVEDVAGMAESSIDKVALPNPRELRRQAKLFIEAKDAQSTAQTMADLQERLAATEELLRQAMEAKPVEKAKARRGRPPKADAEEAA